jgi:hypothetical protein
LFLLILYYNKINKDLHLYQWLCFYIYILIEPWLYYLKLLNFILIKYFFFLKILSFFLKFKFQTTFKSIFFTNNTKISYKNIFFFKSKKLLNFIFKLTIYSTQLFFKIHPSQFSNFIYNMSLNIYFTNFIKFNNFWQNIYNLIYNIFFYNIFFIIFSSPFFFKEIKSLNLKLKNIISKHWKYLQSCMFMLQKIKINDWLYIIYYLSHVKVSIIIFSNTFFYKNTLNFLKQKNFYLIGMIPVSINIHKVHFAIPVITDNIFLELFFLRFFLQIKKWSYWICIKKYKKIWSSFLI